MKWFRIIFLIISFVVLFLIAYAIINSLISSKYEIEEPPKLNKIDIEIADGYLNSLIMWLWCFLGYVGLNVVFLLGSMFSKKK
jgi:uncharacterized SAM-binding protein YcdF (DUF218 family)